MSNRDMHLSDRQLLMHLDGELSSSENKRVVTHLEACWTCRTHQQDLAAAIGDLVHAQQSEMNATLPSGTGPRALLKAHLAQLGAQKPGRFQNLFFVPNGFAWLLAASVCGLLCLFLVIRLASYRQSHSNVVVTVPNPRLTPGAALLVNRGAVCSEAQTNNKAVSRAVARKVFDEYGIVPGDSRNYEVDYLITPALGGADDIRNLWPQTQSSTLWNAEVKDALEQRLRSMVCDGQLDLPEAQQEIAMNWIAAYKKYFHTDKPLASR